MFKYRDACYTRERKRKKGQTRRAKDDDRSVLYLEISSGGGGGVRRAFMRDRHARLPPQSSTSAVYPGCIAPRAPLGSRPTRLEVRFFFFFFEPLNYLVSSEVCVKFIAGYSSGVIQVPLCSGCLN